MKMGSFVRRWLKRLRGGDRGTVAISFLFCLPILMLLIGAIVQLALLINAQLTLNHAVQSAARSAMTSLPTDPQIETVNGPNNVAQAALINLAMLSPAGTEATADSDAVAQALTTLGVNLPGDYSLRYAHAAAATSVSWYQIDANGNSLSLSQGPYPTIAAPRIRLTVTYDYRMDVPAIQMFAGLFIGQNKTVDGITGNYLTLTATYDVQLSDGREVPTSVTGDATGGGVAQ